MKIAYIFAPSKFKDSMFQHQGKTRSNRHNVHIAIFLSFIAGVVNMCGIFELNTLVTNVTGHFALFANGIFTFHYTKALTLLIYLSSFLTGSFTSGVMIEWMIAKKKMNIYVLPTVLEASVLLAVPFIKLYFKSVPNEALAALLLIAMGIQNAFVTKISNAVVRTTHLTGLFTDLGIELSQLFFKHNKHTQGKNISTIKLRLNIMTFFFLGVITGGFVYHTIKIYTLILAAVILLSGLIADALHFKYVKRLLRRSKVDFL